MGAKRVIYHGYATRSLDEAEQLFRTRFDKEPSAFVIQKGYTVFGSRENHEKIFESRFAGFMAIYIPIELSREEIIMLEFEPTYAPQRTYKAEQERNDTDTHKRYCFYCGQVFLTDPMSFKIYCEKFECRQRHAEAKASRDEVEARYKKHTSVTKRVGVKSTEEEQIEQEYQEAIPTSKKPVILQPKEYDFSLDNPFSRAIQGWVYLIEADNGLYKLGRSDDVWSRFGALSTENAAHLTLRHAIYTADYVASEGWLHKQFAAKRHHGEWFRLQPEDIDWFCQLVDGALDGITIQKNGL